MNDTIIVEVDGELGEPDYLPERPRPSWGMPAAAVVVVLLVVGLAWTLVSGGESAGEPSATPTSTTVVRASASSTSAPPAPSTTPSTTPPTGAPVEEEPPVDLTDPVSATAPALDAWGEFAATGDLSIVEGFFDLDGPQYAQLAVEDVDRSGGLPYEITIEQPEVTVEGDVAHVRGTVVWSRAGEPDQSYEWSIELRRAGSEWRLWTVRTVEA